MEIALKDVNPGHGIKGPLRQLKLLSTLAQKALMASAGKPRRRSALRVKSRGSSQPAQMPALWCEGAIEIAGTIKKGERRRDGQREIKRSRLASKDSTPTTEYAIQVAPQVHNILSMS